MAVESKIPATKEELHKIHRVPVGDTPYVRAKHVQLVERDPEGAIALFWAAINAGDRVESALKDMAIVMKQLGRPLEGIEAIKSFRHRCSLHAQESLDNVLLDLYKKCGNIDGQIFLLKDRLRLIQQGLAFNGRPTKTARSHGRKFQISIKQETSRLLSNLGWAYMQKLNYAEAEIVYRKAQLFYPDANKACNLGVCLLKQGKAEEAAAVLDGLSRSRYKRDPKLSERAKQLLKEIQDFKQSLGSTGSVESTDNQIRMPEASTSGIDEAKKSKLEELLNGFDEWASWESDDGYRMLEWAAEIATQVARKRQRRLPVFEQIIPINDLSS